MIADANASGNEAERNGRQTHRNRRLDTERKWNRVTDRERQRAERGAPHDPAQLALDGHRARARQRAHQHRQARAKIGGQVDVLETIEQRDDAHEVLGIESGAQHREGTRRTQHRARQIDRRQPPRQRRGVARHVRTLRKHQREMQEERRQHDHRNGVAPIEDPVDAIEPAAEREGEEAEERDRQPEEVQRGLVGRPARAHRRADQQREDADRRQHVIEQAGAARHRRQRQVGHFLRAEPQQRVGVPIAGPSLVLQGDHVEPRVDGLVVDGKQDVARLHAGAAGGRRRRHFGGHHAHRALDPEHAVFDFVGRGARNDVRQTEGEQGERHRDGQGRLPPLTPPRLAVVHGHISSA